MQRWRMFIIKIWRISCANSLAVCGGISLMFFVEDAVYNIALALTVISIAMFYYVSYRDFGDFTETPSEQFVWRVFVTRIWKITLANALWIFSGLTYLFFVTGIHLFMLTLLTIIGFSMLYIDAYRTMVVADATSTTDTDANA
jgi:hypothetical protein